MIFIFDKLTSKIESEYNSMKDRKDLKNFI